MKKFLLALVALALFISCSTEDVATQPQLKTTNVELEIAPQVAAPQTTGKQIPRNSIPAPVNRIDIKIVNDATGKIKTEQFDIVSNNSGNTNKPSISDVELGNSTITVTTTTDAAQKFVLAPTSGSTTSVLTNLKANVPYALYASEILKKYIEENLKLKIPLYTKNGRLLSVFVFDNVAALNGFKAVITAKVGSDTQTTTLDRNGLVYFEWSNAKAVAGAKVTYTIDVQPVNNNNNIHKIYTIESEIIASTSISCIYTIDADKAPKVTTTVDDIIFEFEPWKEIDCATCKDKK